MRRLFLLLSMVGWSLAACHMSEANAPGRVASLDDVTNGFIEATPAPNPTAGVFYNDGTDGDVRARTENYFASDLSKVVGFDNFGPLDGNSASTQPTAPTPVERLLIQKGEVRVEVARPDDVARDFQAKIKAWGGYLQNQVGTTLVLRLPAPKFDEAFAAAKELGRVLVESRAANDVTEEYVDLGLRLDTAKKSRDRLLEVLKKAEKVEDILRVEAELRRLGEEIERMEGRIKFLQDQVAMATLQVAFQATSTPPPPPKRSRQWSRFGWINRVGAEQMLRGEF